MAGLGFGHTESAGAAANRAFKSQLNKVEERSFVEQEREVGRKTRHSEDRVCGASPPYTTPCAQGKPTVALSQNCNVHRTVRRLPLLWTNR